MMGKSARTITYYRTYKTAVSFSIFNEKMGAGNWPCVDFGWPQDPECQLV